jgi:putative hydrolase of the HAD superfamily
MTTQPTNIRLIVFDLGKVLVDFDYRIAARHLSQYTHLSPEQIIDLLLHSPLLLEYERGEMSNADFYQALVRKTGLRASFEEFATRFGDIFSPIEPMLDLLDRVQASNRPTAVLSNTNDLAIRHIRSHYPFFDRFKHRVLSFEHRSMKPDPALYRVLEQASGVPPAQILFLDDRPENVEAAQQLGWQAFVHHDPAATRRTFTELGLLSN